MNKTNYSFAFSPTAFRRESTTVWTLVLQSLIGRGCCEILVVIAQSSMGCTPLLCTVTHPEWMGLETRCTLSRASAAQLYLLRESESHSLVTGRCWENEVMVSAIHV